MLERNLSAAGGTVFLPMEEIGRIVTAPTILVADDKQSIPKAQMEFGGLRTDIPRSRILSRRDAFKLHPMRTRIASMLILKSIWIRLPSSAEQ